MNRKEINEQHVTRCMLDVLRIAYTSIRSGNADIGEPDCVITTPIGFLGIEVTTAYYSEQQAKAEWRPDRYTKSGPLGILYPPSEDEPDRKLADAILSRIKEKKNKRYSGVGQCILLVPMDAQMTDDDFIIQNLPPLRSALGNAAPFSAIYLGASRGEEGVYVVWPVFPAPSAS